MFTVLNALIAPPLWEILRSSLSLRLITKWGPVLAGSHDESERRRDVLITFHFVRGPLRREALQIEEKDAAK